MEVDTVLLSLPTLVNTSLGKHSRKKDFRDSRLEAGGFPSVPKEDVALFF